MALAWSPLLNLGVAELDRQHQEIFHRIFNLLDAIKEGLGKAQVQGTLEFLAGYLRDHFSLEERYMLDNQYSGYAEHKNQHDTFRGELRALQAKFDEEGPSNSLAVRLQYKMFAWLQSHIIEVDTRLAAFFKSLSPKVRASFN